MGFVYFADISMGIDADHGSIELFTEPGKPVLHIPALIGVENQDIGFRNVLDSLVNLAQRGYTP